MEFCNECGALLYPKKDMKNGNRVYQCRMCGKKAVKKSPNKEDSILHVDLNTEEQKIWFVKDKE